MNKNNTIYTLLLVAASVTFGFSNTSRADGGSFRQNEDSAQLTNKTIRIMTYNAENLFDTDHDEGKGDWEYLPKNFPGKEAGCKEGNPQYFQKCLDSDWTNSKLKHKLANISRVILSNGKPDVVILEEIENDNVLGMLAKTMGYRNHILVEGPDSRGIDVGVIFKEGPLQYWRHVSRPVGGAGFNSKPTRDLLTVFFKVPEKKNVILGVYGNHWPSQAAPTPVRIATAKIVRNYIEDDMKTYGQNLYVVSGGDYNTIREDAPSPFAEVFTNNFLLDTRELAQRAGVNLNKMPDGTYFFPPKLSWDILDRFFVSENLIQKKDLQLKAKSYQILSPDFAMTNFTYPVNEQNPTPRTIRVPKRFNEDGTTAETIGFTDHLPVAIDLVIK